MTTYVKTGDTHPITWGVRADGEAVDLTGKTVAVHVRPTLGGAAVTLTATVTDAEAGVVSHTLTGTLPAGEYELEIQVTGGGTVTTTPSRGYDRLVVEAQIA